MSFTRISVYLILTFLVSMPAFAKNETLAERGKRMCEESGVPLKDCTMLPPAQRNTGPNANVATATSELGPFGDAGPGPAAFGTGKYGWCDDCTSFLAAAPVTPWSDFGGRQFQPLRDEDEQRTASVDDTPPSGAAGDGGGDDGDSGDGDSGDGDSGDGGRGDGGRGDDGRGEEGGDGGDDGDGGTDGGQICD